MELVNVDLLGRFKSSDVKKNKFKESLKDKRKRISEKCIFLLACILSFGLMIYSIVR